MSPEIQKRLRAKLKAFRSKYPYETRRYQFKGMDSEPQEINLVTKQKAPGDRTYPAEHIIRNRLERQESDVLELQNIIHQVLILGGKVRGWPI